MKDRQLREPTTARGLESWKSSLGFELEMQRWIAAIYVSYLWRLDHYWLKTSPIDDGLLRQDSDDAYRHLAKEMLPIRWRLLKRLAFVSYCLTTTLRHSKDGLRRPPPLFRLGTSTTKRIYALTLNGRDRLTSYQQTAVALMRCGGVDWGEMRQSAFNATASVDNIVNCNLIAILYRLWEAKKDTHAL